MNLLIIAIGAALVNNVVLSQFLGLCPFLGVSKKDLTQPQAWVVPLSVLSQFHQQSAA